MVHRYYPHTIDLRSLSLSLVDYDDDHRTINPFSLLCMVYCILEMLFRFMYFFFLGRGCCVPFHPAIRSLWKDGWRRIIPKTTTITWLALAVNVYSHEGRNGNLFLYTHVCLLGMGLLDVDDSSSSSSISSKLNYMLGRPFVEIFKTTPC